MSEMERNRQVALYHRIEAIGGQIYSATFEMMRRFVNHPQRVRNVLEYIHRHDQVIRTRKILPV